MTEYIVLKKYPKIEVKLLDNGFNLLDSQTEENSGFYAYNDLRSVELNNVWFPRLSKFLRTITYLANGVPFFPDAETCKKANLILRFKNTELGIWITDTYMARKAKKLEKLLDKKLDAMRFRDLDS